MKSMKRNIPNELALETGFCWKNVAVIVGHGVKWDAIFSRFLTIDIGRLASEEVVIHIE